MIWHSPSSPVSITLTPVPKPVERSPMDTTPTTPHVKVHNEGMDPAVAALMAARPVTDTGMNSLLPLLALTGALGHRGDHGHSAIAPLATAAAERSAAFAEASAIANTTGAKDAVLATNVAKDFLSSEISSLAKQLCCSEAQVIQAVNALTPQMFQQFSTLTQGMNQGFSAAAMQACQDTAAIQTAISRAENALALQAQVNASATALASCNTNNLINTVSCDIKQAINADGNATRALINDIRLNDLQGKLNDVKNSLSNAEQTNTILTALRCGPCGSGVPVPVVR